MEDLETRVGRINRFTSGADVLERFVAARAEATVLGKFAQYMYQASREDAGLRSDDREPALTPKGDQNSA
jgi:hypothetical protein